MKRTILLLALALVTLTASAQNAASITLSSISWVYNLGYHYRMDAIGSILELTK